MDTTIPFVHRVSPAEADAWLAALGDAAPELSIVDFARLSDAERASARVAIAANPDASALRTLPELRWIQSLWAGVEGIVQELADLPVPIVRMEDPQMAETMAEAVLTWTLYLHRDMPRYFRQQLLSQWLQHPVRLARERRVGILGLGKLGTAAAQVLCQHGFHVSGWSGSEKSAAFATYWGTDGLYQLLSLSDIVIVLAPLTEATRGLLDARALSVLPQGASVINFARGALIDDQALLQALDAGHLSHAVLDVFTQEPLPAHSAFWQHAKITVLPHVSAPTNKPTACAIVARQLRNYFSTGAIPAAVDRSRGY